MKELDHVAIKVKSIEESLNFYCKEFGAEVISKYDDWAFIRLANIKMALIASKKHPEHIAFEVDSFDALEKMGLRIFEHRDGSASCYSEDPDGNVVEYIFYKK